jgi:hypothetical protein
MRTAGRRIDGDRYVEELSLAVAEDWRREDEKILGLTLVRIKLHAL